MYRMDIQCAAAIAGFSFMETDFWVKVSAEFLDFLEPRFSILFSKGFAVFGFSFVIY